MGAKLSVAQFLSASFGELLDLRGRYSHSSQVFAAAAAASDICIDPFRAPPPRRCHRKKEGEKWGNEREGLFPRNWGGAVTGGDIVAAIEFSCPFDSVG